MNPRSIQTLLASLLNLWSIGIALLCFGSLCGARVEASPAGCRQSCISLGTLSHPYLCNSLATRDTSESNYYGSSDAGYNLASGISHVNSWAGDQAEADAVDSYTLVGADPGFPVSITVHMSVTVLVQRSCSCDICCSGGQVHASLSDSLTTPVTSTLSSTGSFQLALPLHESVGQPFTLHWGAGASSGNYDYNVGSADGSISLTFVLPPGMGIMSCGGYSAGLVTAAEHRTWGAVKTYYR